MPTTITAHTFEDACIIMGYLESDAKCKKHGSEKYLFTCEDLDVTAFCRSLMVIGFDLKTIDIENHG